MKLPSKHLKFSWLPMLFLVLTGGSMLFIFFRKEILYFSFFLFFSLFVIKNLYRRELLVFMQLVVLFLSLLTINYLFALSPQSTQKLLANIVIFTTSIFSAMYYCRKKIKNCLFLIFIWFKNNFNSRPY